MHRALREQLSAVRPDVVHLEGFASAAFLPTIRAAVSAPVVVRAENVEHELWSQRARAERRPLLRWLLEREADRVRAFELESWRAAWHDRLAGTCVIYAWEAKPDETFLAIQKVNSWRGHKPSEHTLIIDERTFEGEIQIYARNCSIGNRADAG